MALVKFYRGDKTKYNASSHADGIFFSTSTHEIYLDGEAYGGSEELMNTIIKSAELTDLSADTITLKLTKNDNSVFTVTLPKATDTQAGLMSKADKVELTAATAAIGEINDALETKLNLDFSNTTEERSTLTNNEKIPFHDGTTSGTVSVGLLKGLKGDKGDAFEYSDFTADQLASLKGADGVSPVISVGTVNTLAAGSNATATITGTQANPVLNLGIPKGSDATAPDYTLVETAANADKKQTFTLKANDNVVSTIDINKQTKEDIGLGKVENLSKAEILADVALTGVPTAPTADKANNSTQVATTAFVKTAVNDLVNGAPETLDTIGEIAAALDNNKDIIDVLNESIGKKANTEDVAANYLGIHSTADAAAKITTDAGSTTKPVYFNEGIPVEIGYSIAKDVPADAKFTDTEEIAIGNVEPTNADVEVWIDTEHDYDSAVTVSTIDEVQAGTAMTGGGTTGVITINHADVLTSNAGEYGSETAIPKIVVNEQGHVTSISTVAVNIPEGLSVEGTAPISVNTADGVATVSHNDSTVTAGTYGTSVAIPQVSVDSKGHVTNVTETSIPVATETQLGLIKMAVKTQAEFDALEVKDPNCIYFITE